MEKFGLDLDEESALNNLEQTNPHAAHKHPLQEWINLIPHAERCQDQHCNQAKCKQLKELMIHTESCAHKTTGECMNCSQLQHFYSRHAKQCKEANCEISCCRSYKQMLADHRNSQRIKQEITLSRRILFIDTQQETIEC